MFLTSRGLPLAFFSNPSKIEQIFMRLVIGVGAISFVAMGIGGVCDSFNPKYSLSEAIFQAIVLGFTCLIAAIILGWVALSKNYFNQK